MRAELDFKRGNSKAVSEGNSTQCQIVLRSANSAENRYSFLPLQPKTVSMRTGTARILNQSHIFFPNDRCEMT